MGRYLKAALIAATVLPLGLAVSPLSAHGFGQRYDLPVPLNLFLIGAAATVVASFVLIGLFVGGGSSRFRYPRSDLLSAPVVGPVLGSRVLPPLLAAVSLGLFLLVVMTGLIGVNRPIDNLSPTFVWIIWWVGMGYLSALAGNLWWAVNPWKAGYDLARALLARGRDERPPLRYPERLDVWPAVLLFLLFAWTENVYAGASRPFSLAVLVLAYSAVTWTGMAVFGKHQWLSRGEAFTVLFGYFARFSPTEVRVTNRGACRDCSAACSHLDLDCVDCYRCYDLAAPEHRQLNLRPFAVGLTLPRGVSAGTAAFVILALATVTFDGFQDTPVWASALSFALDLTGGPAGLSADVLGGAGLIAVPLLFFAVYLGFCQAIRRFAGVQTPVWDVARAFVFSLVPIALAYNLAHFISLLAVQGQLIIPLISDPFGYGWDLFGTADYRINLNVINARVVWYVSVIAIVLGHVVSVYVAHLISLREMPDHASALRSQYPMLALMVIYTATSLWIIAQPVVQ